MCRSEVSLASIVQKVSVRSAAHKCHSRMSLRLSLRRVARLLKGVVQECPTQKCHAQVSLKSVALRGGSKMSCSEVSRKSVARKCRSIVSLRSVARVVAPKCLVETSLRGVAQKCLLELPPKSCARGVGSGVVTECVAQKCPTRTWLVRKRRAKCVSQKCCAQVSFKNVAQIVARCHCTSNFEPRVSRRIALGFVASIRFLQEETLIKKTFLRATLRWPLISTPGVLG